MRFSLCLSHPTGLKWNCVFKSQVNNCAKLLMPPSSPLCVAVAHVADNTSPEVAFTMLQIDYAYTFDDLKIEINYVVLLHVLLTYSRCLVNLLYCNKVGCQHITHSRRVISSPNHRSSHSVMISKSKEKSLLKGSMIAALCSAALSFVEMLQ